MDHEEDRNLNLFAPGPVNLSQAAWEGLTTPTIHHRSKAFEDFYGSFILSLREAFMTSGEVAVLTTSGTGGMEAAVASLIGPSQKVVIPVFGKFSERWVEICKVYGIETVVVEFEPGRSPEPDDIIPRLEEKHVTAVLLTHCETSTGALTDLRSISEAIDEWSRLHGREVLIVADCISTLCVDELRMEEWHIDCCIAASQKGLLAPPGLAFVAINDRCLEVLKHNKRKTYYLDLLKYVENTPVYPFTPSVHVMRAADASLKRLLATGLDAVWEYYRHAAGAIRMLLSESGFEPVATRQASAAVAFWAGDVDPQVLAAKLERTSGIFIAQGQADLKSRLFRISPIGKTRSHLDHLAQALVEVLPTFGRSINKRAIERFKQTIGEVKVQW